MASEVQRAASPLPQVRLDQKPTVRRRVSNWAFWGICGLGLALVITPAVWVIWGVVARAIPHWHWNVIWTTGQGNGGGLAGEIVGTLLLTAGVAVGAGFVGTMSGIYLAEYGRGPVSSYLRGASEVLAGIPSIVLGYVGYVALVVTFHWGFSLLAGWIVLSIMVVPYIAKTTEASLRNVPTSYREGAEALGMPPIYALRKIALRSALPGITTGMLVALAIAVGETAPLLYTAGFSPHVPSLQPTHAPVGYLTYAVWTFYNEPQKSAVYLAYDAALLLIVFVLLLIVSARVVVALTQRHTEGR